MVVPKTIEQILVVLQEQNRILSFQKPVWTFEDFCVFSNLSTDYVRKLHSEGKIPFYRPFGKKLFISREDAIAVLMQNPVINNSINTKQVNNYLLNSKTAA